MRQKKQIGLLFQKLHFCSSENLHLSEIYKDRLAFTQEYFSTEEYFEVKNFAFFFFVWERFISGKKYLSIILLIFNSFSVVATFYH